MDYKKQNAYVAGETLHVTEQEFYLKGDRRIDLVGEDFDEAIVIFSEDASEFELPQASEDLAEITVTDEDSFSASRRLGGKCLVMNFASARHRGGGFLTGANAQEEALCRESTLYVSLESDAAAAVYDYNNRHRNPCKYNAMILSPNVCVFRDIKDEFLDEPFTTAVITVPALNKNGGAKNIPTNLIDDVMVSRLRNMFAAAAHYGYKNLVLGAWGCGAFGHEPEKVAEYFCRLLIAEKFAAYFDKIVFAILDRGAKKNLRAFQKIFDDAATSMSKIDAINQQVLQMDSAISRFELNGGIVVHRLATGSLAGLFQAALATDGYFQDEGFTDTSALHIDAPGEDFIELKILVPAGTGRGAYLAPMSQFPEECQFTLNRGTIYKVSAIERNESGICQVTVMAIGRKPKELF